MKAASAVRPAFFLLAAMTFLPETPSAGFSSPSARLERLRAAIADSLEVLQKRKSMTLAGETVRFRPDLARFYAERGHRPAWIVSGRHALPAAWGLADAVRKSPLEGLDSLEYHPRVFATLLPPFGRSFSWGKGPSPEAAAVLDILLTDAYLKLASHMLDGRVHPLARANRWQAEPDKVDLAAYLARTLVQEEDVQASLRRLAPADPDYGRMKYWLARYRAIASKGGWKAIPPPPPRESSRAGKYAHRLCMRLAAEGEMDPFDCGDYGYAIEEDDGGADDRDAEGGGGGDGGGGEPVDGQALAEGLRRFQGHHGLPVTGRLDEATRRELNVPVQDRIKQIRFNLEGWRWLPRDLGERHVRVNIAECVLTAWEQGRPVLGMKVVVGRPEDSTPVLSDRIVSVLLNPPWHVPETIAGEEILPELQKDPAYLERQNMELLTSWTDRGEVILADTVDWSEITPEDFQSDKVRFRIRQKAGDGSALGKVKFTLTNPFQVYLHDTPAREFFNRRGRALSHGCVRVERPLDLADWLLRPAWTRESMEAEIRKQEATILPVGGNGVPVHILYWTAFTDSQGGLQFRRDIYGWDRKMKADLRTRTAGL